MTSANFQQTAAKPKINSPHVDVKRLQTFTADVHCQPNAAKIQSGQISKLLSIVSRQNHVKLVVIARTRSGERT